MQGALACSTAPCMACLKGSACVPPHALHLLVGQVPVLAVQPLYQGVAAVMLIGAAARWAGRAGILCSNPGLLSLVCTGLLRLRCWLTSCWQAVRRGRLLRWLLIG